MAEPREILLGDEVFADGADGVWLETDGDGTVVAAGHALERDGVVVGRPLHEALASLAVESPAFGASVFEIVALDSQGTSLRIRRAGDTPAETASPDAAARHLANVNLKLQTEIRRRRQLERRILSVSETEQRRLSGELHDGLGQHLAAVAYLAGNLANSLREREIPESTDAQWIGRLLKDAVAKTRALSRGLWPVSLERGTLTQTLQQLAEDVDSIYGVRCTVEQVDEPPLLAPAIAHHVFRIIQESVNNATKHGRARRIDIRLERVGAAFAFSVVNDGETVDLDAARAGPGQGLAGMHLRAEAIGARLTMEPVPGGGMEVTLTLGGRDATGGSR
jgi:signal transduction histidine kinase